MASPSSSPERANMRTVVRLRPSEKERLQQLAERERISSSEVIRRLIRDSDSLMTKQEEEMIESVLKMISTSVREANDCMSRTIDKFDRLHEEIMQRDIA